MGVVQREREDRTDDHVSDTLLTAGLIRFVGGTV